MKIICRFISVILISLMALSCSKDNEEMTGIGEKGNNKAVTAKNIKYQFKSAAYTRGNVGSKVADQVVGVATAEIDEDYMFVAELVNAGVIPQTRGEGDVSLEPIDGFDVFTFYAQEAKGAPRYQKLADGDFTFDVPTEGVNDLVFLGREGTKTTYERADVALARNGCTFEVVDAMNLCYTAMQFDGSSVPDNVDLVFLPLFAQIGSISCAETTSGATAADGTNIDAGWPIVGIDNVIIKQGAQESAQVTVKSDGVFYELADNSELMLNSYDQNIDVIPNGNPLILNMDITLKDLGTKNAQFTFTDILESGYRYMIRVTVKKKGVVVKFFVNTQQLGTYSESFNVIQNQTVNKGVQNSSIFYYKYGEEITLPTNPQRIGTSYFDPTQVMTFEGWYTTAACDKADKLKDAKYKLNSETFESLKTGDVVNIYAYFEPHFYFWNSSATIAQGGTKVPTGTSFASNGDKATDPYFAQLPTGNDYRKYATAPKYFDSGYTDDKQQGVWFLKWNPESGTPGASTYTMVPEYQCETVLTTNFNTISNGNFPAGVNKDDYFFVPVLGEWNYNNDGKCSTITSQDAYCWASNIHEVYGVQSDTTVPIIYFSDQGVLVDRDTKYQNKYRGKLVRTEGILRYWPDETYSIIFDLSTGVTIGSQQNGGTQDY